jgi:acyl carrier protein
LVDDASFVEDLMADSIKLVEMMLRMEEMGIDIPLESAWEVQTVGDAYRVYSEHASSQA